MFCKTFPGDSMSRNKDKHEGASGRTYHIMSEAERASGRRGGWTTLEVSLPISCLFRVLIHSRLSKSHHPVVRHSHGI